MPESLTRADLARLRETHREGKYLSMCASCHGDWPCDVVALLDVAEAADRFIADWHGDDDPYPALVKLAALLGRAEGVGDSE